LVSPPIPYANNTLSNLVAPTAINQDLIFNKVPAASSIIQTANRSSTGSDDLFLQSGTGTGSGSVTLRTSDSTLSTGGVLVRTGASSVAGSGAIQILTGSGITGTGGLSLASGNTAGATLSGSVSLTTGNSVSGTTGGIVLTTGTTTGTRGDIILNSSLVTLNSDLIFNKTNAIVQTKTPTGNVPSEAITIKSGNSTVAGGGASGSTNILTGDTANFSSGSVNIKTGTSSNFNSGSINISSGNADNATRGYISLNSNGVVIGFSPAATPPVDSAVLELRDEGALLLNRLDTAARDGLSPTPGMIIYNTQTNSFEGYSGAVPTWAALGGGGGGGGANTALSNLVSPTAVNQDLIFAKVPAAQVLVKTADGDGTTIGSQVISLLSGDTTGAFSSGSVTVKSGVVAGASISGSATFGTGNSGSASGTVTLSTGSAAAGSSSGFIQMLTGSAVNNISGQIFIATGDGSGTVGRGGPIQIQTGATVGSSASGSITITTGGGFGTNSPTGLISIKSGNAAGTSASGSVTITSGTTVTGTSGAISIKSGTPSSTGSTGNVIINSSNATGSGSSGVAYLNSGDTVNNASGDVALYSGNCSGTGASGIITISTGTLTNASSGGSGRVQVTTGNTISASSSGQITFTTGSTTGASADSGFITLQSGTSARNSGPINITSGASTSTSGAVNISTGNSPTTSSGSIAFTTGTSSTAANKGLITMVTRGLIVGATTQTSASSLLELNSTTGAFLLSRLDTAQRDALSPVNGMLIYNTDIPGFQAYRGGWQTFAQNVPSTQTPQWTVSASPPTSTVEFNNQVYLFQQGQAQFIYTVVSVPQTYIAGTGISMTMKIYSPGTVGTTISMLSVATLVRSTDPMSTNANNFNNTVPGTISVVNAPITFFHDLTTGTGTINGIAVQPGDLIKLTYRRNTGDTSTADARVLPAAVSVRFT